MANSEKGTCPPFAVPFHVPFNTTIAKLALCASNAILFIMGFVALGKGTTHDSLLPSPAPGCRFLHITRLLFWGSAQERRSGEAWPPAYQSDGPVRPVDQEVA